MRQSPKYTSNPKDAGNHNKTLPRKIDNDHKRDQLERMDSVYQLDNAAVITKEYLRSIASREYKNPVISFFLSFSAEKTMRDPKNWVTIFHSLKAEELKRNKLISSLNHSQEKTFKEDLEFVTKVLEQKLVTEGIQSVVIFKSGKDLQLIAGLPLKLDQDMLIIDSNPYTSPLSGMLHEQKKVMIVKIMKDHTTFYLYNMGFTSEFHHIDPELPDLEVEKTRPEKMQLHQLEHLNHHFKECSDYLYKQSIAGTFDYVIVVGHEDITTKKFINTLHPTVKEKLLDSSNISPHELNKNTIPSLINEALETYQMNREGLDEAELAQARGQGTLIEGIDQVLAAHNRGLLRELYIQGDCQVNGFTCPTRHYISIEDGKPCPICSKKLQQVKNCIDELIENSVANNIKVHLFIKQPEIMDKYRQIAGVTYPPTS